MNHEAGNVVIIGGGVIGVACAHELHHAGYRVTVVDKGHIGSGCSHGNCGLVCPSHVLPLAEPGAIRAALKAMLTPGNAFRIRPRIDWHLWSWLWRFARRCNRPAMLESAHAIHPLLTSSLALYGELVAQHKLECEWKKQGLLFVYRDQRLLDEYQAVNELLASEFDEPAQRMDGQELRAFEPALKDGLAGAWLFEHDAHLRPDRLLSSWRRLLESSGVRFVENRELTGIERSGDKATAALSSGDRLEADWFVMATGSWTPRLSHMLGLRIPIEPGKGYSLTFPRPASCPRIPIIFPEHRVVVTPLESSMRLGSIMEFAGYDSRIRPRNLRLLTTGAGHYLREPLPMDATEEWFGWRPMTYDSTPVIGPCPGFSNLILATGHNMLGVSMAPATARLVCELVTHRTPHLPLEPYLPQRFFG